MHHGQSARRIKPVVACNGERFRPVIDIQGNGVVRLNRSRQMRHDIAHQDFDAGIIQWPTGMTSQRTVVPVNDRFQQFGNVNLRGGSEFLEYGAQGETHAESPN